ncbi:MAG TPA: D-2-hydroxyacid dehydrogenase [Gemmatimonadales bacterium]|nr:D-2-hydroxyacid dehydrogenase [Gemmatimonadales bacterium]
MPLPSTPDRLLIVDRDREALATWINERRPALEIRTRDRAEASQADLDWADAYMGFRPPPTLALDGIAWVHCTGAGVDGFLFRRPFPDDTLLTRNDEPFGAQIGEWCVARALAVTQQLPGLLDDQHHRRWVPRELAPLRGSRVLVVGAGEVGRGVAGAFAALGCTVHGVSRSGGARAPFETVSQVEHLASVVADAEFLVLTLPLTEATFHLVDGGLLAHCRNAVLMNAGRGALVDEAAIIPAFQAGHLRAAALDVFEQEPLPENSPLWSDPRILISPHVAGLTTVAGAGGSFLQVCSALERGARPDLAVDTGRGY